MNSLLVATNAVSPLVICIALGVFLRRIGLLTHDIAYGMDKVNYNVLIPLLLFRSIYTADLGEDFEPSYMLFIFALFFVEIILWFAIVPIFEKDPKKKGTLIQTGFRCNNTVFGVAILQQMYGGEHMGLLGSSVIGASIFPVIFAVIAFEMGKGEKTDFKTKAKRVFINPIMISCLGGVLFLLLGWDFPGPIDSAMKSLSSAGTPMALLTLGAALEFSALKENARDLVIGVVGKSVVHPLLFMTVAVLLGFRGPQLANIAIVSCAPVAISSFSMAKQMGGDEQLDAQLIVLTNISAVIAIFCCTVIMSSNGWM